MTRARLVRRIGRVIVATLLLASVILSATVSALLTSIAALLSPVAALLSVTSVTSLLSVLSSLLLRLVVLLVSLLAEVCGRPEVPRESSKRRAH